MANLRILLTFVALIISPLLVQTQTSTPLVDTKGAPYIETIAYIKSKCTTPAECKLAVTPTFTVANRNWKNFVSLCVGKQYFPNYNPTAGVTCTSASNALINTQIIARASSSSSNFQPAVYSHTISTAYLQSLKDFLASKLRQ